MKVVNLLSKRLAFKESRENEHDGVSQLSENRSSGQNKAASKGGCMRLIYILAWELIQIEEDLALFQTRLRTSTVVVVFGVVAQGHDEDGMHTVVIKIQEFIHLVFIETFDRCGINAEGGGALKQCCHCDIGLLSFPVESLAGTFTQINKEFSGFEAFFGNFFVGNAAVFDFLVEKGVLEFVVQTLSDGDHDKVGASVDAVPVEVGNCRTNAFLGIVACAPKEDPRLAVDGRRRELKNCL